MTRRKDERERRREREKKKQREKEWEKEWEKQKKKELLAQRREALQQQPEVKWINVIENDGQKAPVVKKHLVRMKDNQNMDSLKNELSNKLNLNWGPVRNIYTPAGGTIVESLDSLEANKAYAVGGVKFKPMPAFQEENSRSLKHKYDKKIRRSRKYSKSPRSRYEKSNSRKKSKSPLKYKKKNINRKSTNAVLKYETLRKRRTKTKSPVSVSHETSKKNKYREIKSKDSRSNNKSVKTNRYSKSSSRKSRTHSHSTSRNPSEESNYSRRTTSRYSRRNSGSRFESEDSRKSSGSRYSRKRSQSSSEYSEDSGYSRRSSTNSTSDSSDSHDRYSDSDSAKSIDTRYSRRSVSRRGSDEVIDSADSNRTHDYSLRDESRRARFTGHGKPESSSGTVVYRAQNGHSFGAEIVPDSTQTKINIPLDYKEAKEVEEEH